MKIFKETQRFNQWWFISLQVIVLLVLIFKFINEFQKIENNTSAKSIIPLVLSFIIMVLVFFFIGSIKLKTRIDEKGVFYQFYPIHFKFKTVAWSDLSKCYVRKYAPISEYGGWGIRGFGKKGLIGFRGKGRAFNIKGNMGIQLHLVDGGNLLLGTQNPEKAKATINNYLHKLNNNSVR